MITTTQIYNEKILSDHREMRMKVIFNGHQEIDGHYLKNVTIHEVSNGEDSLTLGSVCSHSIKIDMFDPGDILYDEGYVEVFIGLVLAQGIEWVPMGTFYVSSVARHNEYEVSLGGYDGVVLLNNDYVPSIDFPATLYDVVLDIANQCHLTLKDQVYEDIVIEKAYEVTCKEMLSYMASLMGKNARMNRFHELEFFWYHDSSYVLPLELQYELGFQKINIPIVISSLTSGDEDHVITVGSGYGMTFVNPYMTQERLDSIFENINGFTYTLATLKWRGDPCLEVLDILSVQDATDHLSKILIMDNTISFDGGMSSSIECKGQTEKDVVMSKSPTEIKLKKFYNTLLESFKNTTEKILGHSGGYYSIDVDNQGYPTGWTIMNTPTLRDDTHLWRMSMGGFGYSEDGRKTFRNFAFDLDGNFSANAVTTGVLQGKCFDLDLNNGTVCIGERNQEGNIENPVLQYNPSIGFYIQGMTELSSTVTQIKNSIYTELKLNYVNNQTYEEALDKYYPNYTTQPLKITAITKDILKEEVAHVVYVFKRKGQSDLDYVDLIDGETVVDNVLTVSHNLTESVEYKAYASVVVDGKIFTAEQSITMNLNTLNASTINGEVVQIEASTDLFIKKDGNYTPDTITLTPRFLNCHFNLWSYSKDLGITYENIIPVQNKVNNEEGNSIVETNVNGILFDTVSYELQITDEAECFNMTNVVVFKLKADIENATNTIVLTKDSDIVTQVNQIITEISQLKESYTKVFQELDGLSGTITSTVENMETKYNDTVEEINTQLSQVIQTSTSIETQFQTLKETVEGNEKDLETLTTFIRKTAKGIEVGELEAAV